MEIERKSHVLWPAIFLNPCVCVCVIPIFLVLYFLPKVSSRVFIRQVIIEHECLSALVTFADRCVSVSLTLTAVSMYAMYAVYVCVCS